MVYYKRYPADISAAPLVAALAANCADPETWLIRVMTKAADLASRVVNEEDEDNEEES